MTTIPSFIKRLEKIGIKVDLVGNYPWVYLYKVNGKRVQGTYLSDHHFTVFFRNKRDEITDISTVFDKIRETLQRNQ